MTSHATPVPHLYIHSPVALFKARANHPSAVTYPINTITFDGVTLGAFGDLVEDMTLLLGSADGLDDYGRTRIKGGATSTTIPIGRASQGVEDGTLTIVDNAYITVLDDFRVWAKLPYQDPNGVDYKDATEPVGTHMTEIPPVANCGPGTAAYTSGGIITVTFPGGGADLSYAMADGATISTYSWDVGDGTITVGTSASAVITATFPAGFRWVALTVVDSNGTPHTARCPVLAVNAAADVTIPKFRVESHRLTQQGSAISFRIFDDLARATYPDGTLVMYWWDAPSSASDRSHMKFIGWEQNSNAGSRADRHGLIRETVLECVDVAGRLESLPAFPQALQREDEDDVDEQWALMPTATISKVLHYIIFWHSTALGVADFFLPPTGDDYPSMRLDTIPSTSTLYNQIDDRAKSMTPDHHFVCNAQGQLSFLADWQLMDVGDRPTVAGILTEDDWNDLRFDYQRPPRVHVLTASAVVCSTDWIYIRGVKTLPLAFSKAPGPAFSQGTNEATEAEGLTISQADLNAVTGHRYARLNSRYGQARIKIPSGDIWDYVPALMQRLQLNISAATAAQRGLPFTTVNFMVKDINIRYPTGKTGMWIDADMTIELETSGFAALTHVPEEEEEPDDYEVPQPPDFTPPLPGDTDYFYGDMGPFIVWDGAHVLRTWDIQEAPPVWELVDTGITGNIYDGQYVQASATRVGMWLMTSTGIWWCDNIKAAGVVWTNVLPIATVQAADATPETGVVGFKTMFNYASEPGYLCVATGPTSGASNNPNYQHAYFWHTHDYGATWTQVDMNSFLRDVGGVFIHGYFHSGLYAMNIYRSAPGTIWCVRETPNIGGDVDIRVFYSSDLGHTWSMGATLSGDGGNIPFGSPSLLNPFPNATDPSYATSGIATGYNTLQKSTDGWATKSNITTPTGYSGMSHLWRVNKQTFDNNHILGWWQHTAENQMHLLESNDGGANWSLLYDSGLSEANIPNIPGATLSAARHNTPNGWPPDVDQWAVVRAAGAGETTNLVMLTLDNFATAPADKTGNIIALVGAWTSGPCDGFALPK